MAKCICTLYKDQSITTVSIITPISASITTIVLATSGIFREGKGSSASESTPPKDEGALKMVKLADALYTHPGKKCSYVSFTCLPHLPTISTFSEVVGIKFCNIWYFLSLRFPFVKTGSLPVHWPPLSPSQQFCTKQLS